MVTPSGQHHWAHSLSLSYQSCHRAESRWPFDGLFNFVAISSTWKKKIYLAVSGLGCSVQALSWHAGLNAPLHAVSQLLSQGLNLHPLHWAHGFLASRPPGKPLNHFRLTLFSLKQFLYFTVNKRLWMILLVSKTQMKRKVAFKKKWILCLFKKTSGISFTWTKKGMERQGLGKDMLSSQETQADHQWRLLSSDHL